MGKRAKCYEVGGARKGKLYKIADLRRIYWHHHRRVVAPITPMPAPDTPPRVPDVPDAPIEPTPTPEPEGETADPLVPAPAKKTSVWGAARIDEEEEEEESGEWSENSESENDSGGGSDVDMGEMNDNEWDKLGSCQVFEECNSSALLWREVDILCKKGVTDGSGVCLFFGGDEYEGLPGVYRLDDGVLYDDDGDVIKTKDMLLNVD